jgi:cytochrome c biogenesis protein
MVVREDPMTDPERLEKMESRYRTESALLVEIAANRMQRILKGAGWKRSRKVERNGSTVLFAQRGAWTRLGAHIVHLSILVIFAGAAIGTWFGYKAYIFLPEGRSATNVFLQKNQDPVPLGFELVYDRFEMVHYPNGMIREYRSDLTVYDPQRATPYHKRSIVNDPLNYGGLSFYIADNFPLEQYFIEIRNTATGNEHAFRIPAEREVAWPGTDVAFSIEELRADSEGAVRQALIRLSDGDSEPTIFWMDNNSAVTFAHAGQEFTLSFRQLYTTLFLVAKDPGVWVVYFGFGLMVVGLCISFFLSHQRIWIYVAATKNQGSQILIGGAANKHKPAFESRFQELITRIQKDDTIAAKPQESEKPQRKRRKAAA